MGVLRAIGYPCSRYNRPDEAIEDPQVVANDLVVGLDHPVFGHYVTTGMPLRMEATPVVVRGPSPCLGAHTVEVLTEIGFDPRRIEELLRAGAVASGGQSSVEPQPDEQRSTREGP
jgi:crotonobetainyl-CoA:carnitine CoA-transferase CaiB-like acyl-CoA transferase